jgi:hypothetical protein
VPGAAVPTRRAITAVSCSNCHATGFIPVTDEVEPIAKANARQIGLDRNQVEQLESLYISRFGRQARESLGFAARSG